MNNFPLLAGEGKGMGQNMNHYLWVTEQVTSKSTSRVDADTVFPKTDAGQGVPVPGSRIWFLTWILSTVSAAENTRYAQGRWFLNKTNILAENTRYAQGRWFLNKTNILAESTRYAKARWFLNKTNVSWEHEICTRTGALVSKHMRCPFYTLIRSFPRAFSNSTSDIPLSKKNGHCFWCNCSTSFGRHQWSPWCRSLQSTRAPRLHGCQGWYSKNSFLFSNCYFTLYIHIWYTNTVYLCLVKFYITILSSRTI